MSPPQGATLSADSGLFVWSVPTPPASRYWFEIGLDSLFTMFRVVDSTLTDTAKVFRPLVSGRQYFWKVRSGSPGNWGPFSETRAFSVVITDVADRELPTAISLSQNYPNPFNPTTRIEFALPVQSRVRIDVYTALGEHVAVILDAEMPAGIHTAQFDASALSSGPYIIRMLTPQASLVRKIMLMK
jgi:hypothetical protein